MTRKNTYEIKLHGRTYRFELHKEHYCVNGGLAIEAVDADSGEPFDVITVNILAGLSPDEACIDTNNCPWAPGFMKDNGIATDTGLSFPSGFCTYPLYKFNKEALDAMVEDSED